MRLAGDSTHPRSRGIYLIQGFEDFATASSEVLRTWKLPLRRVVVSRWLAEIASQHNLDATLIENGVDTECFWPGMPNAHREPSVLAMVADQPLKRADLVVAVFRALHERRPEVQLCTFGAGARPRGLPSCATHVRSPKPDELAALYRSAQLFLCTSDFEGFGLPALEAMSCGAAVVSTVNGGVPAFAGDAARYAARGSATDLLCAVESLLDDGCGRAALAIRGLKRASELSLRATASKFRDVIDEELAGMRDG